MALEFFQQPAGGAFCHPVIFTVSERHVFEQVLVALLDQDRLLGIMRGGVFAKDDLSQLDAPA